MPRPLLFPDRLQTYGPKGTLAALQARMPRDEDMAKLLRRIILEWIERTPPTVAR